MTAFSTLALFNKLPQLKIQYSIAIFAFFSNAITKNINKSHFKFKYKYRKFQQKNKQLFVHLYFENDWNYYYYENLHICCCLLLMQFLFINKFI